MDIEKRKAKQKAGRKKEKEWRKRDRNQYQESGKRMKK